MLGTLLPDLIVKLPKMKAGLLLALVKDTEVPHSSPANLRKSQDTSTAYFSLALFAEDALPVFAATGVNVTTASQTDFGRGNQLAYALAIWRLFKAETWHVQGIAEKMLRLKAVLPRADVSQLVAGCPALLLSYDVSALEGNLGKLRWAHVGCKVIKQAAVGHAPLHVWCCSLVSEMA